MAASKKNTDLAPAPALALAEFNPRDPQTILAAANQLAQFIGDNKLASQIQGRAYVQAEGWQFLFAVAGLDVVAAKPARLRGQGRPDAEICYEAEARLFDAQGREVGYGYALCSDSERSKKGWAEYAIASMAQTRAIGKAGRNRFAFVMKAAGFEPTPAEEMSEVGTSVEVVQGPRGNGAGGSATKSEPPVTPAASSSAAPVASDGAEASIAGPTEIPAEILAKFTRQFEAVTSGIELKKLWESLTKNEATALFEVKEAAKVRLAATAEQAKTLVGVQPAGGNIKDSGTDTALVDEFTEQPTMPTATFTPAIKEQKEAVIRLTNHHLITRKEKTAALLNLPKLDTERCRQLLIKLRDTLEQREGSAPVTEADKMGEVRAAIALLLKNDAQHLNPDEEGATRLVVEDAASTLEQLEEALEKARGWVLDGMSYGTDADLAEVEEATA